jgi:hypothetical protein
MLITPLFGCVRPQNVAQSANEAPPLPDRRLLGNNVGFVVIWVRRNVGPSNPKLRLQMTMLQDDSWFIANKGAKLGDGGGARHGYECVSDPTSVIKEVHLEFPGANFVEHFVWNHVSKTALSSSFGEVRAISKTGRYILMERLDNLDVADRKNSPAIPDWVTDVWPNNFGKNAAGEIKIRDYANVALSEVFSAVPPRKRNWQK